jgi:ketosteroid isomerase-like protein
VGRMPDPELLLRSAYRAFKARDVEAALELMHPGVDWPNAWEGGRVVGHAAVRDYWSRQFAAISSSVEPLRFVEESDDSITVEARRVTQSRKQTTTARCLTQSRKQLSPPMYFWETLTPVGRAKAEHHRSSNQ